MIGIREIDWLPLIERNVRLRENYIHKLYRTSVTIGYANRILPVPSNKTKGAKIINYCTVNLLTTT